MTILIIAEHNNQILKNATYPLVTAAQLLGNEIDLLVVGYQCDAVCEDAAKLSLLKRILQIDAKEYEHQLAENTAALIAELSENYDYVLMGATTFGKNILPRVAALKDVAMIGDVTKIISADTFERPMYAGNVIATIQSADKLKLLTIRPTAFAAAKQEITAVSKIEKIAKIIPNELSRFDHQELTQSERPELTSARIIISGGRGLKSAENFKLLENLADELGAAIGASRAAVDAGFAPNDYQVGQTGKVVAPDLYIAIGISGAIQHLAGMKDSKVVVAINNDAEAPIFEAADYGLVGDLFSILPALREELKKIK